MDNLPALLSNQIHLWSCFCDEIIDSELLAQYWDLLNPEEKAKQKRFHFPGHRHQYLVTRAMVRSVLSMYANVAGKDWRFSKNHYGRPEIANDLDIPLRFNLSHTDGLIICGVTLENDMGVDVENTGRDNAILDIAHRYFSKTETENLFQQPSREQRSRFFDFWTLKESYIKARGMGLSIPLSQFSFHLKDNEPVRISFGPELSDNPDNWYFRQYKPGTDHKIAVAVKSALAPIITSRKVTPLLGWHDFVMPEIVA